MEEKNEIENAFQKFLKNPTHWFPDGIISVNLPLLLRFHLLPEGKKLPEPFQWPKRFYPQETAERTTLYPDDFIIWLTSHRKNHTDQTLVMMARKKWGFPHPEVAFLASGVYNTPSFIYGLIEQFLYEIEENEQFLHSVKGGSGLR